MNAKKIIDFSERALLRDAPKRELIQMVLTLRSELKTIKTESANTISSLEERLASKESELEMRGRM